MAKVEINIPIFERNMKLHNKKGLRRAYTSAYTHPTEYLIHAPLSASTKVVLEVTIDKEFVEKFQDLLKAKGYTILGSRNTFHLENLLADYENAKDLFANQVDKIAEVQKDLEQRKAENKDYEEVENEDCKFFFLPYNENVDSLYDFVKASKTEILDFAKANDITIMLKAIAFTNQLEGFFGFNFFDADVKEEEVVVDYAASLTVGADLGIAAATYAAAVLLTAIGKSKEELADPDLNVHLISENIKYEKA